jgi:hypothetical protein
MQTTHAMLLWAAHDGRNADDVISTRKPVDLRGRLARDGTALMRALWAICAPTGWTARRLVVGQLVSQHRHPPPLFIRQRLAGWVSLAVPGPRMVSMTTVLRCHVVTIGQRLGQAGQPGRQRPEVVILARPSCVAVRVCRAGR